MMIRRSSNDDACCGASYDRCISNAPAPSASAAAKAKAAIGPETARSSAAASGPSSVPKESSSPRTTLALVSSSGTVHSAGSSAE